MASNDDCPVNPWQWGPVDMLDGVHMHGALALPQVVELPLLTYFMLKILNLAETKSAGSTRWMPVYAYVGSYANLVLRSSDYLDIYPSFIQIFQHFNHGHWSCSKPHRHGR